MDDIVSALNPRSRAQLHQVADLMLEIYKTLARMEYFDLECIEEGPHDITALIPEYQARRINPLIIYLYSILPYIISPAPQDFYQGGEFADFRDTIKFEESRDPFSTNQHEERMSSWMTPLSFIGGDSATAIIYSAKKHGIWIFGQEDFGSLDPMLQSQNESAVQTLEGEQEHGIYCNGDGRPAAEVLRDINASYLSLESVPGEGHWGTADWREEVVRPLYEKHGWLAGDFDGEGFLVDQARQNARMQVQEFLQDAKDKPTNTSRLIADDDDPKWDALHEAINMASTLQDEWMARWNLLDAQCINRHHCRNLVKAKKDAEIEHYFKQDEMVVWEQDWLHHEAQEKRKRLAYEEVNQAPDQSEQTRKLIIRQFQKGIEIYAKAYETARMEAQRLLPGKNLADVCGGAVEWDESDRSRAREIKARLEFMTKEVELKQQFLDRLPEGTQAVAELVEKSIQSFTTFIEQATRTRDEIMSTLPSE